MIPFLVVHWRGNDGVGEERTDSGDFRSALQQDLDLTWRWQGMVEKEKSR